MENQSQISSLLPRPWCRHADDGPIEDAEGYKYLIDNFSMTKEQVAKIAGKSRSYISNSIRILSLPDFIIDALRDGKITSGHAKALLMFDDEKRMLEAINKNSI